MELNEEYMKNIVDEIIEKAGGQAELSRLLKIPFHIVHSWSRRGRISQAYVVQIEELFGIPREKIRPDLKYLFRKL